MTLAEKPFEKFRGWLEKTSNDFRDSKELLGSAILISTKIQFDKALSEARKQIEERKEYHFGTTHQIYVSEDDWILNNVFPKSDSIAEKN